MLVKDKKAEQKEFFLEKMDIITRCYRILGLPGEQVIYINGGWDYIGMFGKDTIKVNSYTIKLVD
jgi:hypothetical protein